MNKILILPLAAALAAPAYAVTFQRWQTADGATVTYAERRELPIVHMEIVFKGAGQTGESVKGAAAMTADMLTSGSEQYSEEELYDRSNRLGITVGSSSVPPLGLMRQIRKLTGYPLRGASTTYAVSHIDLGKSTFDPAKIAAAEAMERQLEAQRVACKTEPRPEAHD